VNDSDLLPEAPASVRARLYAALHLGTQGDVEFYLRACEGARKILEYGCGAGRIALALAERGHTVIGVDLDVALLALARERKAAREAELGRELPAEFVEGDMTSFSKRGCDRVLIPYSALWCLTGLEAKQQCLAKARTSLKRSGQLVFDVYDADIMAEDWSEDGAVGDGAVGDGDEAAAAPPVEQDDYEELHRVKLDGVTYRVWERNTWNRETRLMLVDYRLVPAPSRKLPSSPTASGYQLTLTHSVLWRHELAELLEDCGFDVEWGVDEAGEETPFAEQLVVRAVLA
jgi:SAM-dependent methyltransferase